MEKKLLAIAGNSSLATSVFAEAISRGFSIHATHRRTSSSLRDDVHWRKLDLSNGNSVRAFLKAKEINDLDLVIFFAGEPSPSEPNLRSAYIEAHLTNTIAVIENLIKKLNEQGTLIYISSRSALHPSRDVAYSAVKAGVSAAAKSMTLQLRPGQRILSVAPGLIKKSAMYFDMPEDIRREHEVRAKGELIDVEIFARKLFETLENTDNIDNGSVIEIGPNYK